MSESETARSMRVAAEGGSAPVAVAPRRRGWLWAGGAVGVLAAGGALVLLVGTKSADELIEESTRAMAAGDRVAAAIHLKNALQAEPDNVRVRLLHGSLLLEGGDARAALDELKRAQELGAARDAVLPLLARALIQRKEYQEALDATAPAAGAAQGADSPDLIALRGHAMYFLGRVEQAREAYRLALAADPKQTDALLGEARIAIAERNQAAALAKAEEAVASGPRNADALALLGDLKRLAGDEAAAAAAYERAVAIAPQAHATRLSLASVYIGQGANEKARAQLAVVLKALPDSPTPNFLLATMEFRAGRFEEARALTAKVLGVQGNHVASLLMMGASSFMAKDYATAERALRRALVLSPRNVQARKLLGASLVRLQQARNALEELLPLVKQLPGDADLMATIGEAHLQLKEHGRATEYLQKAAALAPKDPGARLNLGRTRLAAGDLDQALAELQTARAAAPQGREASILLAMTHLQRGEFDRTIAIVSEMEGKGTKSPVTLNLLGASHLGKRDFTAATKFFEQALAIDPAYMPAVMNLIQVDLRERDQRTAVRRLEKVLQQSPNNIQAMLALASLLSGRQETQDEALRLIERAQRTDQESAEPLLQLARFHLARGNVGGALDAAHRALQAKITSAETLAAVGQLQSDARAPRRALDTYIRMAAEYPDLPLAHMRLGMVHGQVGNTAAARQSLRRAIELKRDYAEAKVQLALLEAKAGNSGGALALAEEIIKQLPKSSVGYSVKGDVLVQSRRVAEAIPVFEEAFRLQRTAAFVLKLHQAHALAGNLERGEAVVDQWLAQNPSDLTTRKFVADYSLSIRRYAVAQRHYEALVKESPGDQQALNNLAVTYDGLKDPRALETAARAYRLNQANPFVADTYGWLLARQGNNERAREILAKAVAGAPDVPDIRHHHAVVLANAGLRKEARAELDRAFSLKGQLADDAGAKALLERLRN